MFTKARGCIIVWRSNAGSKLNFFKTVDKSIHQNEHFNFSNLLTCRATGWPAGQLGYLQDYRVTCRTAGLPAGLQGYLQGYKFTCSATGLPAGLQGFCSTTGLPAGLQGYLQGFRVTCRVQGYLQDYRKIKMWLKPKLGDISKSARF